MKIRSSLAALLVAFFALTASAAEQKYVQAFDVEGLGSTLVVTTVVGNESRYVVNLGQPGKWLTIDVKDVILGFSNTILQTKRGTIDLPSPTNMGMSPVWIDEHHTRRTLKPLDVSDAELATWKLPND